MVKDVLFFFLARGHPTLHKISRQMGQLTTARVFFHPKCHRHTRRAVYNIITMQHLYWPRYVTLTFIRTLRDGSLASIQCRSLVGQILVALLHLRTRALQLNDTLLNISVLSNISVLLNISVFDGCWGTTGINNTC